MAAVRIEPIERFLSHVEVQENGCWLWTASKTKDGYGYFSLTHSLTLRAHRWAYEYFIGPIPDEMQLDHLCRNPSCVQPEHLEPVTIRENSRRGLNGMLKPQKTSRYIGVGWDQQTKKWRALIHLNRKKYTLGYCVSEEEAYQVYLDALSAYEKDKTLPMSPLLTKKSSKYKGVSWTEARKKWKAYIRIEGKECHLGYFQTEEEAYQARLQFSEKIGGR